MNLPKTIVNDKAIRPLKKWEDDTRARLKDIDRLIAAAAKRHPTDGNIHERTDRPGMIYLHTRQSAGKPRQREYVGTGPQAKAQALDRIKAHREIVALKAEQARLIQALHRLKEELTTALESARAEATGQRFIPARW